jgi:5-methylcytosine-specific restriction endonuclease McrA
MNKCLWCGKPVNNKVCNASCQMYYEYKIGVRDKNKITKKCREVANKKIKENNWLNSKKSRDKLRETMKTDDYRNKMRDLHLGSKNGMFGKKPWNFLGLDKRDKYGIADRGFDWKRIKKLIKERDNYNCQECGISEQDTVQYLQVHHKVKYSIFKDNSPENLITLCPKCHVKKEHQFVKVSGIRRVKENVKTYNLSVEDDETYIANNFIVHNCRSVLQYIQVD